ncbi:GDP-Man:Man(1)GlcNAc(2)-PP-dolichol alpha-1,3-mannosyltransferase [Aspergillus chevalieri]|uniref:Alpha-1,3/1,6-mannosyltransferase ALG2 n=1 Tax=Aspergillus chevalieri TaxID=182096 RepID=A0A7R7VSF1_ASPCH|nr:alpha-1,3-mannosyltransferase-like protein [Aspergillus chevalieri]BCR89951.1 alpha-1,3-mannosyltransferase-like protein [Aspergillus chevalieri]
MMSPTRRVSQTSKFTLSPHQSRTTPSGTTEMPRQPPNITIIHPDLGIGGAERLIIDVALALQSRGHKVTIYTSHRDTGHCFDEARDGTLDVRVRGNTIFPGSVAGRGHVLMAVLRQVHLTLSVLGELATAGPMTTTTDEKVDEVEEVFIIDQLAACVPILKLLGEGFAHATRGKQRILFYCHFPDQLLARRDERNTLLRLAKAIYRYPFDWFEGWAMSAADRVVANSRFTRGVVGDVFGKDTLGDVSVVYPCVDTAEKEKKIGEDGVEGELWGGKKILLSINRFERKKDMGLAIRAYHGLGEERRRRTRLVIAGGYDNRVQENVQYHKELDTLATTLGLQTATSKTIISALSVPDSIDVLFLLSVPTAFRDTLLSQAKLLLYTPVNEHFGIVPVEAMHAGIPVLASNTGGPLETIVEGETGWLRDANKVDDWTDVMDKVLYGLDQESTQHMAVAGKTRVEEEFSLRAMGDRLEENIGEMLRSERRPFNGSQQLLVLLSLSGVLLSVLAFWTIKAM